MQIAGTDPGSSIEAPWINKLSIADDFLKLKSLLLFEQDDFCIWHDVAGLHGMEAGPITALPFFWTEFIIYGAVAE